MNKEIKLGIIGSSDGNGHPYSWSAIFNGYNQKIMKNSGYPTISNYLKKQKFPDIQIKEGKVTHVWTQDKNLSNHIASSTFIDNVVDDYHELIDKVDAILLARDDAENHFKIAKPFLEAGMPIYIDKPFALTVFDAKELIKLQRYKGQIFSCSAMRYSAELKLSDEQKNIVGEICSIHGFVPKSWDKYAVHIIEPILQLIPGRGEILENKIWRHDDKVLLLVNFKTGEEIHIQTCGNSISPISLRIIGTKGWVDLIFTDTFNTFRCALLDFIKGIINKDERIPSNEIIEVVKFIELGRSK